MDNSDSPGFLVYYNAFAMSKLFSNKYSFPLINYQFYRYSPFRTGAHIFTGTTRETILYFDLFFSYC